MLQDVKLFTLRVDKNLVRQFTIQRLKNTIYYTKTNNNAGTLENIVSLQFSEGIDL